MASQPVTSPLGRFHFVSRAGEKEKSTGGGLTPEIEGHQPPGGQAPGNVTGAFNLRW